MSDKREEDDGGKGRDMCACVRLCVERVSQRWNCGGNFRGNEQTWSTPWYYFLMPSERPDAGRRNIAIQQRKRLDGNATGDNLDVRQSREKRQI